MRSNASLALQAYQGPAGDRLPEFNELLGWKLANEVLQEFVEDKDNITISWERRYRASLIVQGFIFDVMEVVCIIAIAFPAITTASLSPPIEYADGPGQTEVT